MTRATTTEILGICATEAYRVTAAMRKRQSGTTKDRRSWEAGHTAGADRADRAHLTPAGADRTPGLGLGLGLAGALTLEDSGNKSNLSDFEKVK